MELLHLLFNRGAVVGKENAAEFFRNLFRSAFCIKSASFLIIRMSVNRRDNKNQRKRNTQQLICCIMHGKTVIVFSFRKYIDKNFNKQKDSRKIF